MKIVADKAIFRVREFFSPHGELVLLPGREITNRHLVDADALLVRTITPVTGKLLENTPVRFVGSATSGFDHIAPNLIAEKGVRVFHAAGCNAMAVVNYVLAALATLSEQRSSDWRTWRVGIIGAGNVGARLGHILESMGMDILVHDPFLDDKHPLAPLFAPLEKVMQQEVVSIHTPLTRHGPYPTHHMIDEALLSGLKNNAVLINAARGELMDNSLLARFLEGRPDVSVILDVWENEPDISLPLLDKVFLGTPHIAGYSMKGKLNGTAWVHDAFCEFFRLDNPMSSTEDDGGALLEVTGETELQILNRLILSAYPISRDALIFKSRKAAAVVARQFDAMRNGYDFRWEFGDCSIRQDNLPDDIRSDLVTIGFRLT